MENDPYKESLSPLAHAEPNQIPPGGFPVAVAKVVQALWQLDVSAPVILVQYHPTCSCRSE